MDNKKKYGILAAIAAAVIIVIILIVTAANKGGDTNTASNSDAAVTEQATEEVYYTPVLMYFVTQNDPGYADYMAMIGELQSEYEGRVEFDIIDIDEEPDAKENFPVENATPFVIMNDTTNTITAISPMCADKETIKGYIDAAL